MGPLQWLTEPILVSYKKELGEEEDTEDIIDLGNSNEEIQTQKKKYMGFVNTPLTPTYDQNLRVYSFDDAPGFTPSYSPIRFNVVYHLLCVGVDY